ncbi:hypothetical protein [Dyadobacter sp. CY323]|uniref:hypothetical protein n=1 Tax=Dyadobacter sp. CY323 TaxID=2907302 RepID=UPI001F416D5B|nr:hypothetical protein [Dyadobacter sp. CY323]MCE6988492.1 hypothetical protein [Dyadobacter sp. CY323]
MKAKEINKIKSLPKGFRVDPTLIDKYADQPLFKEKLDRANAILRKGNLPKFD